VDWLHIGLRIVHIGSAIAWAGGAALFFFYVEPTLNKLGPDAEKFANELINVRKVPIYFAIVSTLTVAGGAILYFGDAGGLQLWTSTTGIVFSIGAVAGILAWIGGSLLVAPAVKKVGAIGQEMKAAGGPPSAELMGRMQAAQHNLRQIGLWDLILIIVAIVCMESARYVG
jgi:putative copper export protein